MFNFSGWCIVFNPMIFGRLNLLKDWNVECVTTQHLGEGYIT
jgi:hypothetical protein